MHTRVLGHIEEHRSYAVTVTPAVAEQLFFVSTYDSTDPDSNAPDQHGYQRPPTKARFVEIAKYFATNGNRYLVTPILASVRIAGAEEIERYLKLFASGDIRTLRATFGEKVASIIDGQHRVFGLVEAWKQNPEFLPQIPFMLFFNLGFVEEAELFNIVNVTQRKLPKALIETTKGDITEADQGSYAQQIRKIAFSLCRETDSVWGPVDGIEQINMTGVRDPNRPVTYEGLRRSTSNMFPPHLLNRLTAIDEALPLKYAKRYWKTVSETCVEGWTGAPASRKEKDPNTGQVIAVKIHYRLKDLVGVASLAKLGKDIITTHIDSQQASKLEELVQKLVAVDWEKRPDNKWMRSQAGFAGQKEMYEMLHGLVYSDKEPEEPTSPVTATEAIEV